MPRSRETRLLREKKRQRDEQKKQRGEWQRAQKL